MRMSSRHNSFKMAATTRREARRRKILQNSEDRLKTIIGSRPSRRSTSEPQQETFELPSIESCSPLSARNEDVVVGDDEISKPRNPSLSNATFETNQGLEVHTVNDTEEASLESYFSGQQPLQEVSNSVPTSNVISSSIKGTWKRTFLNAVLALVLVGRWTCINFDALFAKHCKQGLTCPSQPVELKSKSMIWPFLALQLLLLCVENYRQTSHSANVSILTVVLQLCGIPVKLTNAINILVTWLVTAIKDFAIFLFVVICVHHAVECTIRNGFIQYAVGILDSI